MEYYIYGMGKRGIQLYLDFKNNDIAVKAFIDADPKKQLRGFDKVSCISIEEYKKSKSDENQVIVAIDNPTVTNELALHGIDAIYYKDLDLKLNRKCSPIDTTDAVKEMYNMFYEGADCIK